MGYTVFIGAGEASGDAFGAQLMEALHTARPDITYVGIGGERMLATHLKHSLFPMEDLSLIGITEIIPKLFRLLHHLRSTRRFIQDTQPDLIITIDAPDFYLRLLKHIRKPGIVRRLYQKFFDKKPLKTIPTLHYNAPAVWASRPKRAPALHGIVDHILCLFPMDPPYFTPHGIQATFIGHPLSQNAAHTAPPLPTTQQPLNLLVLFGSRRQEVHTLCEPFIQACVLLTHMYPHTHLLIPTFSSFRAFLKTHLDAHNLSYTFIEPDHKSDAFQRAHLALAASGTVTLELAQHQIPCVIGYKVSPLTYHIAKHIVTIPYICLINILAGKELVHEHIQHACTGANLYQSLQHLMHHTPAMRATLQESLHNVFSRLIAPTHQSPTDRAVSIIQQILNNAK